MAQRKHRDGAFKARVAVEAIGGHKTINEIASAYAIHPSLVGKKSDRRATRAEGALPNTTGLAGT